MAGLTYKQFNGRQVARLIVTDKVTCSIIFQSAVKAFFLPDFFTGGEMV